MAVDRVTVSANLITRNEAAMLPGCLESLSGRVDQIIIVDALSDDETGPIARAFGAHVIDRAWTDDFAAARNAAIAESTGTFILYIDADERLSLPYGGHVADYICAASDFQLVQFQPRRGFTRYGEWRIFRRTADIRFEGVIHETVVPIARRRNATPYVTAIRVDHLGYDGAMEMKWQRNRALLLNAVKSHPMRAYLWLDLAECCTGLGEREQAWQAIVTGIDQARRADTREQGAAHSLLLALAAQHALGEGNNPRPYIEEGLRLRPDDYGLQFLLGQIDLDEGRAEAALAIAKSLQAVDPDLLTDGPLAFDRRIFTDAAFELEALALLALGDSNAAAQAFANAARLSPAESRHRYRHIALASMADCGGTISAA